MYLNKVLLIGNLTKDPEKKSLPSGTVVSSFGLATNRVYRDKDGNNQKQTDFHNVVVFGKQAELVAQYLKKGSMALIEGRITTRSWDADDGTKRYRTEIIADRIQFGPRTSGSGQSQTNDEPKEDVIEYPPDINPDDIPF